MKQKAVRIGLFVCVLAIWGAVWSKVRAPDPQTLAEASPLQVVEKDTIYKIQKLPTHFAFERDPFMAGSGHPKRNVNNSSGSRSDQQTATRARADRKETSETATVWPDMQLKGFVMPKVNESASVAILFVKGKEILVTAGSVVEGINIQKVGPHIVVLEQNGQTKTLVQP